jgi:hypothetical protein
MKKLGSLLVIIFAVFVFITDSDARWYDPEMGRFLSEDPVGFAGGVNFYVYVGNNPVNYRDPFGLHQVGFNGNIVLIVDDYGNPIATYPATSGAQGYMSPLYQNVPWKGPIPAGQYSFDPNDFSVPTGLHLYLRNLLADWGRMRVPLIPAPSTNTFGREYFFIHGGNEPGSAGCIDVGPNDLNFYNIFRGHEGLIPVFINY